MRAVHAGPDGPADAVASDRSAASAFRRKAVAATDRSVVSAFGRTSAAAVVTILSISALLQAQKPPSTKEVVRRVEQYVASYGEKASIVVCTEKYAQKVQGSGMATDGSRTLVSDFALVHADAMQGWLGFRDVIEVDGRRVSDREDRLARVLMGSEGRLDEARRLSDESARYNIGAITRSFNVPTTVLFFFTPGNHGRFTFSLRTAGQDGVWELAFRETDMPTLIRTPEGRSIPSSGTIWIDPETGTVLRTRLQIDAIDGQTSKSRRNEGHVDVVYRLVDELQMWLPASMDEQFEVSTHQIFDRVSGHADYGNYRVFTTSGRIK